MPLRGTDEHEHGRRWMSPKALWRSARRSRDLVHPSHSIGAPPHLAWLRAEADEGVARASVHWPPGQLSRGPARALQQAPPPFGVLRSGGVPRQRPPGAKPGPPPRFICSLRLHNQTMSLKRNVERLRPPLVPYRLRKRTKRRNRFTPLLARSRARVIFEAVSEHLRIETMHQSRLAPGSTP